MTEDRIQVFMDFAGFALLINQEGRNEDDDIKRFGNTQDLDYNIIREISALCTDNYY